MASWKTSTAILALMLLLFAIYFETEAKEIFIDFKEVCKEEYLEEYLKELEEYTRIYKDIEEILVGGHEYAWTNPRSIDSLTQWSKGTEFAVGDSLIFTYDGESDSVLQVGKGAYEACNTAQPIQEFRGGNTTIKLRREGFHYFISGAEGRCEKGQKVRVGVVYDFVHFTAFRDRMNAYAMKGEIEPKNRTSGDLSIGRIKYFEYLDKRFKRDKTK